MPDPDGWQRDRLTAAEAKIRAYHAQLAAIEADVDGWTDEMAHGMRTAVVRLRRQLREPAEPPADDTYRRQAARAAARLHEAHLLAAQYEAYADNDTIPADQRAVYRSVAEAIHKITDPED